MIHCFNATALFRVSKNETKERYRNYYHNNNHIRVKKKIKQDYNYQNMREDYKNYPSTSSGKFWESGSLIMITLTRIAFFFFAQSLEILLRKKCVINAAHRNVYIAHGIDERGLISPYKPPALIRNFPVTCFSCLKSVVKSHIRFWFFFCIFIVVW